MMVKEVKKLWKGSFVSVRDYEVKKAIQMGGLLIHHAGKRMYIYPDSLKEMKPHPYVFKSKTGGKNYRLVDIKFEPVTTDPRQASLL